MSDHSSPVGASEASRQAGHEVTDADAAPLVKVGIGIAVLVGIGFVGMLLLFRTLTYVQPLYDVADEVHPLSETRAVASGPLLQPDPPREKEQLRVYEAEKLTTYDWVDAEAKVARIPVDRAIDILAAQGLPGKTGQGAAAAPTTD